MASRAAPALLSLVALAGCRDRGGVPPADAPPRDASAQGVSLDATIPPAGIAPLSASWIEQLELPDGGLAFVTPPVGARDARPIVVAVHGAVDDPGLMCSAWRLVVDVYAFVVCPAGRPLGAEGPGRKYVWGSGDQIRRRVLEALDAVRARWPEHVRTDAPVVYAAFSQGANMAGALLTSHAARFSRVVLTEGGRRVFEDASVARAFARGGGERVLFTCSQAGCAGPLAAPSAALERAGVAAKIEYSGPHGHSMPPAVREGIHAALPWIVADLAGWERYAAAPKLEGH